MSQGSLSIASPRCDVSACFAVVLSGLVAGSGELSLPLPLCSPVKLVTERVKEQ